MATFKSLSQSHTVDGKYSGRKRIYLESEEDLAVFQRWFFNEGEYIEFISSTEDGSGGCTKVLAFVKKDREMDIISFGIVDRDALMREGIWDLLLEKDDEDFIKARPFGDFIIPLCRWEIENYLLEPDVIHSLLADYGNYSPKGIDKDVLAKKLLGHAVSLIPVIAANVCLHQAGKKALSTGFISDEKKPDIINEKCLDHLLKNNIECGFEDFKVQISSFKSGEDNQEQFWSLSRIIDGKRLIFRYQKEFGLKEDHRFNLAKITKERNLISREIKELIEDIKAAA
jgi:hypothetical protein